MGKLRKAWESYLRDVMPAGAGAIQREETRRAFYAGAASMMSLVVGGMSETDEVTEGDVLCLSGLADELEAHAAALRSGGRRS
jgi:hypothetical protein